MPNTPISPVKQLALLFWLLEEPTIAMPEHKKRELEAALGELLLGVARQQCCQKGQLS